MTIRTLLTLTALAASLHADTTYQTLPFSQNWTNTGLITTDDSWTGVPGILGCRGDGLASTSAVNPQTILAANTCVIDVNANRTDATLTTGGVGEFHLTNPVVALQGSGTARAPYLLIHLNTTGKSNIRVSYTLRDIDNTADNAVQPVALQYRIGETGTFTDIPAAYIADASTGPSLATATNNISVILPAAAENQPQVQLRIMTSDAAGSDEWIGIDDISVAESFNPSGSAAANPASVEQGASTLLTVAVSGGTNPASTGLTVTGNLTAIGGSAAQTLYDDGTNGDVTAGDNIFSVTASVPLAVTTGPKSLGFTIADAQSRSGATTLIVTVTPQIQSRTIPQIQGSGTASPYAGEPVRTTGIVTARISNGFFLQNPTPDADPATSEGIFVFTSAAPPASAAVGNSVQVTGTISEFRRSTVPNGPSVTELTSPTVALLTTGNPVPAPRALTTADLTPSGGIAQLERFEGMRISFAGLTSVAPTGGSTSEANATSTSNGTFYAVITGAARPYREPGVQLGDPDPALPFPTIPRYDGNPEIFAVDSGRLNGAASSDVTSGVHIGAATGVLHQDFGEYRFLPEAALATSPNLSATPVPAALPGELKVASFNLERFYDTTNDPGVSDVALTSAGFERRLKKASLAIRNVLGLPDVLAVVEMENLATLQTLAARINNDAGANSPNYQACLVEGNDVGGIDVGFLFSARVTLPDCAQFGKTETFINPDNGQSDILNDRPPLVLRGSVKAPGSDSAYPFTVVVNHLRSLNDIDDPTAGNRVRTKRLKQAEFTATLLQNRRTENTISVGDYNAFQFNDGYVDVMGTIKGAPATVGQAFLTGADLVDPNYTNLVETVPAATGYSYVFAGSAQTLDHVLVNNRVLPRVTRYAVARLDADFPEVYRSDDTRPERISDHDAPVVYLRLPVEITSSTSIAYTPVNYNEGQGYFMANVRVQNQSDKPLPTPFYVVLEGLTAGVHVLNADGITPEGLPYIKVTRDLKPNASEVVQLRFSAPAGTAITYTARIYSTL